jgi:hypothetical protein
VRAVLAVTLATAASCGRVDFDAIAARAPDAAAPTGHDEDGDGIPDAIDNCPVDGTSTDQADRDGDGIGDLCDPNPDDASDRVAVFATFAGGDMPLAIVAGTWTPGADAIETPGAGYAEVRIDLPLANSRQRIGADIVTLGAPDVQQQLAMGAQPADDGDRYFGEVNQLPGVAAYAGASWFDGTSEYTRLAGTDLASGAIPVGNLELEVTMLASANTIAVRTFGVPGADDDHVAEVPGTVGSGVRDGSVLTIGTNGLGLRLRYVWATTTAPP